MIIVIIDRLSRWQNVHQTLLCIWYINKDKTSLIEQECKTYRSILHLVPINSEGNTLLELLMHRFTFRQRGDATRRRQSEPRSLLQSELR